MRGISLFCALLCLLTLGCNKDIVVEREDRIEVEDDTEVVMGQVRLLFDLRSDYPTGNIQPDLVYLDGNPVSETTYINKGRHTFIVERRGYKRKEMLLDVSDDGDGQYRLNAVLEAKERLVKFDIRDQTSDEILTPDQVVFGGEGENSQQTIISDGAFVKPGNKFIVIQKEGYLNISDRISVQPDEDPFILEYKLVPQN